MKLRLFKFLLILQMMAGPLLVHAKGETAPALDDWIGQQREELEHSLKHCLTDAPMLTCVRQLSSSTHSFALWKGDSLVYWSDGIIYISHDVLRESRKHREALVDAGQSFFYAFSPLEDSTFELRAYLPVYCPDERNQELLVKAIERDGYHLSNYCLSLPESVVPLDSASMLNSFTEPLGEAGVQSHKGRAYAWLILFNLLIVAIFLLSGMAHRYAGRFWGSLLVVASVLTVRIVAVQPFFMEDLSELSFFSNRHFNEYFQSSIGDLLLNTVLFLVISLYLLTNLYRNKSRTSSSIKKWALTVTNYVSILFGLLILAFLIRNLLLDANIPLPLDRIFSMNTGSLIVVGSMICFVSGLFLLNYLLTHNISKRGISIPNRIGALSLAGAITLPVFLMLDLEISPFSFYILAFAYVFLLDVFTDTRNISISWLVIWLLFLSGGTSMLLYNYYIDSLTAKKSRLASHIANQINSTPKDQWSPADWEAEKESGFLFGIYEGDRLISGDFSTYAGQYNYDTVPPVGSFARIFRNDMEVMIYRASPGRVVVVSRKASSLISSISLFSFVFCVFVLITILLLFLNTRIELLPPPWNLRFSSKPSLRKRFQLVLFSLLILTFVAVCFFTIYYFRYNAEREKKDEITSALTRTLSYFNSKPELLEDLSNGMGYPLEASRDAEILSGNKLLYYDRGGQRVSAGLTDMGQWPHRLPYNVFRNLKAGQTQSRIALAGRPAGQEMAIGKTGHGLGREAFIALPAPALGGNASESLNDFIGTLLNMYIFMLIVAGSIALAFADSITRPLSKLSEKLKEFKLGGRNEPIEWGSRDELGELIGDYNRMISELDDSAKLLALTEREIAWREMAKQVAHEIKNPLTPMKLSIQHLQYAIRQNGSDAGDLVDRVSNTLVEQIDNLSNIASEFSNFAKLPKPENEKVVLNDVVTSAHDLFRKREDMDINLYVPIDEIYVFADRNHLIRVLNNLLKNAIQAIPPGRRGDIEIKVFKKGEHGYIKVSDNGVGIPEELRDKVFKPNFTSKSSGSGLGLAICANIIDSFNGEIYYNSTEDKGTDFYVKIPLMHMTDNFRQEKRVKL